jgi:hypothetical protein
MTDRRHDDLLGRVADWFEQRLPGGWTNGPAQIDLDRDEIMVLLPLGDDDDPAAFRERTRDQRIALARSAEEQFGRKVSWGTVTPGARHVFTNVRTPITTPLALTERRVLDTLVAGGVAASRSDAVAWCIRAVGRHEADWLSDLHEAALAPDSTPAERPTQF